jgi:hypothetical protein
MRWLASVLLFWLSAAALARGPDGMLGLIQTPNNGLPVILTPGGAFEAVLSQQAELRLRGQKVIPLRPRWTSLPGGRMQAICNVPADVPVGTYAIEGVVGDRTDITPRSVYIRDGFPARYAIAQMSDLHIGLKRPIRSPEAAVTDVIAAVNASDAQFVLVTGDLTHGGKVEQFRSLLTILDACRIPTFVCPGNHDRTGLNYEGFFGPLAYRFRFGEDVYIGYDTKDRCTADEWGSQDADLQVFRRQEAGSRWIIGFSHRYEPDQGMRSQLILFVDAPLDHLIFGHWHRDAEGVVPWGTTPYTSTPATSSGFMRYFNISPEGIRPQKVLSIRGNR